MHVGVNYMASFHIDFIDESDEIEKLKNVVSTNSLANAQCCAKCRHLVELTARCF